MCLFAGRGYTTRDDSPDETYGPEPPPRQAVVCFCRKSVTYDLLICFENKSTNRCFRKIQTSDVWLTLVNFETVWGSYVVTRVETCYSGGTIPVKLLDLPAPTSTYPRQRLLSICLRGEALPLSLSCSLSLGARRPKSAGRW